MRPPVFRRPDWRGRIHISSSPTTSSSGRRSQIPPEIKHPIHQPLTSIHPVNCTNRQHLRNGLRIRANSTQGIHCSGQDAAGVLQVIRTTRPLSNSAWLIFFLCVADEMRHAAPATRCGIECDGSGEKNCRTQIWTRIFSEAVCCVVGLASWRGGCGDRLGRLARVRI